MTDPEIKQPQNRRLGVGVNMEKGNIKIEKQPYGFRPDLD